MKEKKSCHIIKVSMSMLIFLFSFRSYYSFTSSYTLSARCVIKHLKMLSDRALLNMILMSIVFWIDRQKKAHTHTYERLCVVIILACWLTTITIHIAHIIEMNLIIESNVNSTAIFIYSRWLCVLSWSFINISVQNFVRQKYASH